MRGLPWPDEPHLVLWHAQTLLREFRGDGHIAALTVEGLTGAEALVTHGAAGDVPSDTLRLTRQRTDGDWSGALASLRERGWVDADGGFTELGRQRRHGSRTAPTSWRSRRTPRSARNGVRDCGHWRNRGAWR